MYEEFTKRNLENRMVVELRRGGFYLVVDDYLLSANGFMFLGNYNEELKYCNVNEYPNNPYDKEWDIIRVYARVGCLPVTTNRLNKIWERPEIKEVTMSEVEEKFGCKVKIINNNYME
jgi:hypothetical protein